jgi:hypothetical protein
LAVCNLAGLENKDALLLLEEQGDNSGDVLLSHPLERHYHWGCSVSLPCSEWERVGPLRYDHQKRGALRGGLPLREEPPKLQASNDRGFQ